jgi:DNA modification methylase
MVLFSIQPFTTKLINSNLKQFRYNWYWIKNNKTGFAFCNAQPMRRVEDLCVFYDKAPVFNQPNPYKGKPRISDRKVSDSVYNTKTLPKSYHYENATHVDNVLFFEGDNLSGVERYHPTQKPVNLLEFLIRVYTNIGDTVLDNTMGSGSTGVACVNTGRNFIGIEKEQKYFDIAESRIFEAERLFKTNLFDIETLEGKRTPPPNPGSFF